MIGPNFSGHITGSCVKYCLQYCTVSAGMSFPYLFSHFC